MSSKPSADDKEKLALLREFQSAVLTWEIYGMGRPIDADPRELRGYINRNLRAVKQIVVDAGCAKALTISPPASIGGMIMRGVNPLDTIFNPPYLHSLIPVVSDILDETIGVLERGEFKKEAAAAPKVKAPLNRDSRSVFVVHGRDNGAKHEVARLLEQLKLDAIVFHEQASRGKTIIEKIEHYSGVAFAVVILSPDDVGALADDDLKLRPRARQNVILELGYMVARLGRDRVCALVKENVEIPSDFDGVVYVSMDPNGAWKFELGRELKAAGVNVDLNAVA